VCVPEVATLQGACLDEGLVVVVSQQRRQRAAAHPQAHRQVGGLRGMLDGCLQEAMTCSGFWRFRF